MAEHYMRDVPMSQMVPPPVVPAEPPHPLDALLPDICQLLDTCREDFMQRGIWTEWDQSVRDRITAYNLRRASAPAAVERASCLTYCIHPMACSGRDKCIRALASPAPEAGGHAPAQMSLIELNEVAKAFASHYASPHHITFTVEGLRFLLAHLAAPCSTRTSRNVGENAPLDGGEG